ncbi:3,4-dihydroxy-2-butanone 4-phosphate synthase [uncultured archaeon]|nr:3,4-dihydroxy-2-butanone 4-phosphate synthase [uncultured archaeon]
MAFRFDSVESAAKALRRGEFVIMVDDEGRENEGDLVLAAEKANAAKLNFMVNEGRGLMCIPITRGKAVQLDLQKMAVNNDKFDTPFTVSVDAASGGTGISIRDRLATIRAILSENSKPADLNRPGHIFPLVARDGGVLQRPGHTEGAVDLLQVAGMKQVGVICEIMNSNGKMARLPELKKFAGEKGFRIVCLKDIISYLLRNGLKVKKVAETFLPTKFGDFRAVGYLDVIEGKEYVALVKGKVRGKKNVLVRVHSACLTGDVFHSLRCDCNQQLHEALHRINKAGTGVLLYIPHHEGRGIGLLNKLRAYELQDRGKDTVEANTALGLEVDKRDYGTGARILRDLGITSMRLLTNNPKKLNALEGFGLKVAEQVPIRAKPNRHNRLYLETKRLKMGHTL